MYDARQAGEGGEMSVAVEAFKAAEKLKTRGLTERQGEVLVWTIPAIYALIQIELLSSQKV